MIPIVRQDGKRYNRTFHCIFTWQDEYSCVQEILLYCYMQTIFITERIT